ncbi:MAG: hypothetical protein LAO19_13150 [Acidobacteriia bacterium]|nr:hypothetical protein [Terriglobia bacterium]
MLKLITRTSVQNRAILEARQRQLEVTALVAKRDKLQTEFDDIFIQPIEILEGVEVLTGEMIQRAQSLMAQIAKLNKTIGVKGSTRRKL